MAVARWLDSSDTQFSWNTTVPDLVPYLTHTSFKYVNLSQLLSHTSGVTRPGCYRGCTTNMLIDEASYIDFVADQARVRPLHGDFYYNNLGYKLAGLILDHQCGVKLSSLLQEHFFDKWDMCRTFLGHPRPPIDGVSEAYNVLDNGKPIKIPTPLSPDTSFAQASGGMYSCAQDLLRAYVQVMEAIKDPDGSPQVKQTDRLFAAHTGIPAHFGSVAGHHYCLGLAKAALPASIGYTGLNSSLLPGQSMPVIGEYNNIGPVYYDNGSGPGALAAVAILPRHDTVVVVLSNTLALNDCADWVQQLVLSKLVGGPPDCLFVSLAEEARSNNLKGYADLKAKLDNGQGPPPSLELPQYCKPYENIAEYLAIDVELKDGKLVWTKQGRPGEQFPLYHYKGDTFHWMGEWNDMASRGLLLHKAEHYWLVHFHVDRDDGDGDNVGESDVVGLTWVYDPHNRQAGRFANALLDVDDRSQWYEWTRLVESKGETQV